MGCSGHYWVNSTLWESSILQGTYFMLGSVTEADLLRRLTLGFNELNFNTSEQNK